MNRKEAFFIGGVAGGILFFLIYGWRVINPMYDDWLLSGSDLTQHYMGWIFFRNSDWNFPVGLFDLLTYPRKISISFLDAIPLLAIFFKLFRDILPETFQYIGFWGLLCFFLQGGIGALILREFFNKKLDIIIGDIFIILSPIVLQRMFWHSALGAHWLILWALYLVILNRPKEHIVRGTFCIVCLVAVLIHPYLAAMVIMIFIYDALKDAFLLNRSWLKALLAIIIYIFCCIGGLLFTGAFSGMHSSFINGFGDASANLNSFYNNLGHTNIAVTMPVNVKYPEEGYAYLGVGVLVLIFGGFCGGIKRRVLVTRLKILMCTAGGCVFIVALSPYISFNEITLFQLNYPDFIVRIFNVFRSNGRFIWILYYSLMLWGIVNFQKQFWLGRYSTVLLAICLGLQIVDLFPVLKEKRTVFYEEYHYSTLLTSPEWEVMAEQCNTIKFLSCKPDSIDRETYTYLGLQAMHDIAYFAYKNNMKLSDYYTVRQNVEESNNIKHEIWKELLDANADKEVLYIFSQQPENYLGFQNDFEIIEIDNIWVGKIR